MKQKILMLIIVPLIFLLSIIPVFGDENSPIEFGNSTDTTVWVGGSQGIVNSTGDMCIIGGECLSSTDTTIAKWSLTGYLYNNSGSADVNETMMNATTLNVCKALNSSWNYTIDTTVGNCSGDTDCSNILYKSEINTFAELDTIIADATVINKTYADANYIDDTTIGNCSGDTDCGNVLYKSEVNTFAELQSLIADATMLNKTYADSIYEGELDNEAGLYSALSDVSLFLEALVDDTSPQLGGYLDANAQNIGSTTDEVEDVYVGDDNYIYLGNDQDCKIGYNTTMGGGLFDCT